MGVLEEQIVHERNRDTVSRLESLSRYLNTGLAVIAGCSLLLMVLTVVANAAAREISAPYAGTTEIVGWLAAVTTAFGLGYTQLNKGYVDIEALVERFPMGVQNALKSIMLFASTIFFGLVSWKVCVYGINVAENGNLSETMGITFYPLIFLVALGFAGLTLALLVDFLKQVTGGVEK